MVLTCNTWELYSTDTQVAVHMRNTVVSWPHTLQHWLKNSRRVGIFRQAHVQLYSTYQEECWVSTSFSSPNQVGEQCLTGNKPKHHWLHLPILLVVILVSNHRNLPLTQPSNWVDHSCATPLTSILASADFLHLDLISENTPRHICNYCSNFFISKNKLHVVILPTVCCTILRYRFREFGIESTNNSLID